MNKGLSVVKGLLWTAQHSMSRGRMRRYEIVDCLKVPPILVTGYAKAHEDGVR